MNKPDSAKSHQHRKPCSVCREWFTPSAKQGDRQRTCGDDACRIEQRRRTQADWRRRNPQYPAMRRADAAVARIEQAAGGSNLCGFGPPPGVYGRVPWEVAKDAMHAQGIVLMAIFGRLLLKDAKDAMRRQRIEITAEFTGLLREGAKDAMASLPRAAEAPD